MGCLTIIYNVGKNHEPYPCSRGHMTTQRKKLEVRNAPWLRKRPKGVSLPPTPEVAEVKVQTLPDPPQEIRIPEPLPEPESTDPVVAEPTIIPLAPKPKQAVIRPGRRPDYNHALIGLNIGDRLIFHKSPNIEATVADAKCGVILNGTIYHGIDYAAAEAYKVAGINPPKKVNGLADWRDDTGVRLRELYHNVPRLPPTITVK